MYNCPCTALHVRHTVSTSESRTIPSPRAPPASPPSALALARLVRRALQLLVDHLAEARDDLVLALGLFGGRELEDAALLLGRDDLRDEGEGKSSVVAAARRKESERASGARGGRMREERREERARRRTWFSLRTRTAFILLCLLPLMTNPACSYFSICSVSMPISPRRGMRCPSAANAAMAAPSPGRSAPPYAEREALDEPGPVSGMGPTSSSEPSPPPSADADGFSTHSSSSSPSVPVGTSAADGPDDSARDEWRRFERRWRSSSESDSDPSSRCEAAADAERLRLLRSRSRSLSLSLRPWRLERCLDRLDFERRRSSSSSEPDEDEGEGERRLERRCDDDLCFEWRDDECLERDLDLESRESSLRAVGRTRSQERARARARESKRGRTARACEAKGARW